MTCRRCPTPAIPDRVHCADCGAKRAQRAKDWRIRQAKKGRCTQCPAEPVWGKAYCQPHLDAKRDLMRKRRAAEVRVSQE
jgi:hypothetical protein